MLPGLQKKWKVSGSRLVLVLLTFALAGSVTGYAGKQFMQLLGITNPWLYIPIYILAISLLWPFLVILISLPMGQYKFFSGYLNRMRQRLFGKHGKPGVSFESKPTIPSRSPVHLAIFASGTGSNAQKIIDHFRNHPFIKIVLVVSNKRHAGVLSIALKENIPSIILEKEEFFNGDAYVDELKRRNIHLIVLAGFLWKLPSRLIAAWPRRILNIHPALLPNYGGKGLYGHHVHEAVIRAGERESGITIHYVDELYDHGEHILQEKVLIEENDTPETLAKKVQALEHLHFPRVIEEVAGKELLRNEG